LIDKPTNSVVDHDQVYILGPNSRDPLYFLGTGSQEENWLPAGSCKCPRVLQSKYVDWF